MTLSTTIPTTTRLSRSALVVPLVALHVLTLVACSTASASPDAPGAARRPAAQVAPPPPQQLAPDAAVVRRTAAALQSVAGQPR